MGGERDDPQPGFDYWVSFKGQGTYLPNPNGLKRQRQTCPTKGIHYGRADRLYPRLAEQPP